MSFLFNSEGGLNTFGYVSFCFLCIISLFLAGFFASQRAKKKKSPSTVPIKQLVFCGVLIALGFILSYIKIEFAFGGSITLCSMLFITLCGYFYGPAAGFMCGFCYGVLQLIQSPYYLTFFQLCCDYFLAFTSLGISGFFYQKKSGLVSGYVVSVIARGFFHTLGGYLFWMEYMPESFPKSIAFLYPVIYNYSYLLAEAAITLIIINIPSFKSALSRVKAIAYT